MIEINQEYIVNKMEEQGLVPVFNHADAELTIKVLDACYAAGIRVFEFTNRGENALDVFEKLVSHSKKHPDLVLGIGTIFSSEDAENFYDKGAKFIVSPAMIPEVAKFCKGKNLLWIPGCGTVTEIYQALQLGAKVIKVFPGKVLGPEFVQAIKAVYPNVRVMPTGGVSPNHENLTKWFEAGVMCVGMGSKLISKDVLDKKDFEGLKTSVEKTLKLITELRA